VDFKNKSKNNHNEAACVLHQGKMDEWGAKHVVQSYLLDLFLLHMTDMGDKKNPRKRPTPQRIPNEHGVTLGHAIFHPDVMDTTIGACLLSPSKIDQSNIQSLVLATTTVCLIQKGFIIMMAA
jgi:hypothetical protein